MEAALFVGAGVVLLALGIVVIVRGRPRDDGADPFAREISEPAFEPVLIESLGDLRERFGRSTFLPQVVDGQGPAARAHFAGRPWLAAGESWPTCGVCGGPLQFLLQLDLDALPDGGPPQRSGGLLQLFVCTNAAARCELGAAAPGEDSLARVVDAGLAGDVAPLDLAPAPQRASCTIVGWSEELDVPGPEEWESLSAHVPGEDDLIAAVRAAGLPGGRDKLGGWPRWAGWASYPCCPECGGAMELLFQLGASDHVEHVLGDAAIGHLMRCPTHSRQVSFARDRR